MPKRKKADKPGKMSDIMMEMSDQPLLTQRRSTLRKPGMLPLFFANLAWNECIGLGVEQKQSRTFGRRSKPATRTCGMN